MNTIINVSFRSEFIDIAVRLFAQEIGLTATEYEEHANQSSISFGIELSGTKYSIRSIRAWLASALSCGLIYSGTCNEA